MVRRGEIYWLDMPVSQGSVQQGRRPVLVVQNDLGNRYSTTTIVAAITSQRQQRPYPFQVAFSAQESGLRLDGTILCEQIQTIDQVRLGGLAGSVPANRMLEVDQALKRSLGLR